MKHLFSVCLALVVGTSPAISATDRLDDALDAVMAAYESKAGTIDLKRLSDDLKARKLKKAKANVAPVHAAAVQKAPTLPPTMSATEPVSVLLLRDAYSIQSFLSEQNDLSDNGASLSYTRDGIANTQTIAGKGALFYATSQWITPTTVDPNVVRLSHYSFVPGVEWDLRSSKNLHEFSGPVSALLGAEFLIRTPWISTSYIRANAVYTTDASSGGAQVYGAEVAWQPIIAEARIGTTTRLNKEFDLWLGLYPPSRWSTWRRFDPSSSPSASSVRADHDADCIGVWLYTCEQK